MKFGTRKSSAVVAACLGVLSSPGAGAGDRYAELPSLRALPGVEVEWIAPTMNMNGLPMSMQTLRSERSLDDTLARYRDLWRAKKEVGTYRRGPWTILVTRHGRHVRSLHLRESLGATEGVYVASTDPARETPSFETTLTLPPSLSVLRRTGFADTGGDAESLLLRGTQDVRGEAQALRSVMRADGWSIQVDEPARRHGNGHVLSFSRGREFAQAFIGRDARWDHQTWVLLTSMQR